MNRAPLLLPPLVLALTASAYLAGRYARPPQTPATPSAPVATTPPQPLYWYDPMKPEVHFDKPGHSPFMDMELVAKYADAPGTTAGANTSPGVRIDPRMVQNLGIRTAPVTRTGGDATLDVVGTVVVDEHAIRAITSRSSGSLEQLDVKAAGEPVRRGQRLAALYAPDNLAARQELTLAEQSGDTALIAAARSRLRLLGVQSGPGAAAQQNVLLSPLDGVVLNLGARQGEQITPGTVLMTLADLSRVWVDIDIPEAQAAGVRRGQVARLHSTAVPDAEWSARVELLYPQLDNSTRTLKARLVLDNPGLRLRPGMFVRVQLSSGNADEMLTVPSEAVIRTGQRELVILREDDGHFRPAQVRTGAERDGRTAILTGARDGETVVTSGQFLIDSEASLRGIEARMLPVDEPSDEPSESQP